jgi:DNA-nicking Smr family endonuclease
MDSLNPLPELDLHRMTSSQAQRAVMHALHTWRRQGVERAVLITGRGWGNLKQQPILRTKLEAWLSGAEGRKLGVKTWRRVAREGALEIDIAGFGA